MILVFQVKILIHTIEKPHNFLPLIPKFVTHILYLPITTLMLRTNFKRIKEGMFFLIFYLIPFSLWHNVFVHKKKSLTCCIIPSLVNPTSGIEHSSSTDIANCKSSALVSGVLNFGKEGFLALQYCVQEHPHVCVWGKYR